MEHIPWEIRGSEFLQDIFIALENARIQGIMGGDRGDFQWESVIILKWQGRRKDIMDRVRGPTSHKENFTILWMVPCFLGD